MKTNSRDFQSSFRGHRMNQIIPVKKKKGSFGNVSPEKGKKDHAYSVDRHQDSSIFEMSVKNRSMDHKL